MRAMILGVLMVLVAGVGPAEAQTRPGIDPRADQFLRRMSDLLAASQALGFRTSEVHERTLRSGERTELRLSRTVLLRRPDRLRMDISGPERDGIVYYDGKTVTFQGNRLKMYAQAPVPDNLDAAMDYVEERLAMATPVADLLHSTPYAAFVSADTAGTYVGRVEVDGAACHELAFGEPAVDWRICIDDGARPLPRRLDLVYKGGRGSERVVITFRDWDLAPRAPDRVFAFQPPQGYERIPFGRRDAGGGAASPGAPRTP